MRFRRPFAVLFLAFATSFMAWIIISSMHSLRTLRSWTLVSNNNNNNLTSSSGQNSNYDNDGGRSSRVSNQDSPLLLPMLHFFMSSNTKTTNTINDTTIPDFDPLRIRREGPPPSSSVVTNHGADALRHDKWIVLTTISKPTEDVKFLANISGWRVVVVGDTKTPADWNYPNCVFLSVSKQLELGLKTPAHLPYRHYARKNAGYLYAIAHGADIIYETDDDNRPLDRLASFELRPTMSGLMYSSDSTTFNPYRHFGQPTLWPRGFPLSKIGSDHSDESYRLSNQWATPVIQQGVVNGDPDMDALFRLTRKITLRPLEVNFDPAAPPVILPPGVFSPFNSQNTLFLKHALWAMLIPTTTTFRICDIWRGYWAQRLLWEVGGHLGFFPPNAYQQRNAHNYMADMEDEKGMYFNTDRLLVFLANWTCPTRLSFFQCVYKLSLDMATNKFWLEDDVKITKYWLEDLIRVGYVEPQRVKNVVTFRNGKDNLKKVKIEIKTSKLLDLEKKKAMVRVQGTKVQFRASDQPSPEISPNAASTISQIARHTDSIARLCPGISSVLTPTLPMHAPPPSPFHDILLVVVFNWPFYANTHILETIYRPLFPNIAYCGENATQFATDTASLSSTRGLTFVTAPRIYGGYFSPWCAVKAMQVNYKVKGYLMTGDDVLLNVWNFRKFDNSKVWMLSRRHMFDTSVGEANDWAWWKTPVGSTALSSAMTSLTSLASKEEAGGNGRTQLRREDSRVKQHSPNGADKPRIPNSENNNDEILDNLDKPALLRDNIQTKPSSFLARLRNNTGGATIALHAISDVYYIPSRLRGDAIAYLTHFLAHNTFVELSLPLVLYGLENPQHYEVFDGNNLWMSERLNPWSKFNVTNHFLHPIKWSQTDNLGPLCSAYLPLLLAKGHGDV